jgi:hypothetical protein
MKLHLEEITDADRAILKAIISFGPVSPKALRRIVGPSSPKKSAARLQKCGYLFPKTKGTVGYAATESGRRFASF